MSYPAYARPAAHTAAESPAGELPVGSQLGRYVVRGTLGEGGMGVVYRANDLHSGRAVALKTLHMRDPLALYRLKREFRSLADVSHPNLVSLGELAIDGGRPFFTMELVDGVHFQRWIDAGPPPPTAAFFDRLRHGVRQIVAGLRALHAAGKVHCDLKPSNVLVTRDDRIVIVDFGLVRERPVATQETSGQLWGTALYMAPEQARTASVGPAADWYSLGIMLYRALTGGYPFRGSNLEILLAKQEREPPSPSTIARRVPADLDALCSALLRRAPHQRPASAEILERLGAAAHGDTAALTRDTASLTLRSVFVGRRDELALLEGSLARARQQQATVILRGASGVGKTAVVREFLDVVRARYGDAVLLAGRCYQRDAMPYRALDSVIDSLSDYLRRLDQVELVHQLPPDSALLGRVFPVLARVPAIARAAPPPHELENQRLRARVFTALRQLLSRLADRAPVIVFIDDLQWADADGLALLADVFQGPDAPRVLFLGTVRSDTGGGIPPQLARLAHGRGLFAALDLAPLPPRDAKELAEILLERHAPALLPSASTIASEAAGHPLFIDELVRFRSRSRANAASAATGLDEAIWQRIRNLDQSGMALMTTLAIAAVPLSIDTVSQATGTTADHAERLARQLTGEHLARTARTVDDSLALEPYHDRVREVLIDRMDAEARTHWHRRLAEALLQTGATEHAPMELLRHLTLAGERQRAAQLALDAARAAGTSLAFETAAELYRLAIDLGDHPIDVVLSLQRSRAEALVNAGLGSEAATVLEQIAAHVDDQETRVDCLRRAGEQLLLSGHLDRGLALLDSVANECGVQIPVTNRGAQLTLAWRRLQLWVRGNRWQERDVADVPAQELLAQDVHHSVGTSLGLVDPIRGMALVSRAALLAFRLGVRDRVILAMTTEAFTYAGMGDRERAVALIDEASRLAHEAGDFGAIAWATGSAGLVAYTTGRFTDVIPAVDRALALHASMPQEQRARITTGGAYETNVLRHCRMTALTYLGRCNELRHDFHQWLDDARRRGDRFTLANAARGLNIVWLLDDDPELAREQLAADLWTPPRESFHIQHWTALRAAVQIHLYCGTGADARAELATELERSKRSLLLRVAPLRAENHWMLGRLALAEAEAAGADTRDGRRGQRQARAAARRLGRLDLPQARTAAALLRAGAAYQRGNHRRAAEQLLQAEVIACRAGLRIMEAAAQRRRGELIGGGAGRDLIRSVDRWAISEGIRCPEKIVRMYAPGFGQPA